MLLERRPQDSAVAFFFGAAVLPPGEKAFSRGRYSGSIQPGPCIMQASNGAGESI